MQTILVNEIKYGFRHPLFEPLSFECKTGEVTAILGSNGRGKTLLLHTLVGIIPLIAGTITKNDKIGFVPQQFTSSFSYSVLDIVLMGRASAVSLLKMPSKEDENIAHEALKRLKISDLAEQEYNKLSGGQKQLVLIARALAMRGKTMLLDEPTAALDLHNQLEVLRLIVSLAKQEQMSLMFTTHEPTHALMTADNTLLLLPEKKWIYGKTVDVLTEANLNAAYGVDIHLVSVTKGGKEHRALMPLFSL